MIIPGYYSIMFMLKLKETTPIASDLVFVERRVAGHVYACCLLQSRRTSCFQPNEHSTKAVRTLKTNKLHGLTYSITCWPVLLTRCSVSSASQDSKSMQNSNYDCSTWTRHFLISHCHLNAVERLVGYRHNGKAVVSGFILRLSESELDFVPSFVMCLFE